MTEQEPEVGGRLFEIVGVDVVDDVGADELVRFVTDQALHPGAAEEDLALGVHEDRRAGAVGDERLEAGFGAIEPTFGRDEVGDVACPGSAGRR